MYKISDRRPKFSPNIFQRAAIAAVLLLIPAISQAAEVRAGRIISIPAGEVVNGNLYAAGGELDISGKIAGGLIAAGGQITLNGEVTRNVSIAGAQIQVNGIIKGDLRMVAGQADLNGAVAGDLIVAGGQVRVHPGAVIGGEVLMAGGQLLLEGAMAKTLRAAGANVTLNGPVGGRIRIRAGKLIVGNHAILLSGMTYLAPDAAEISSAARVSGPVSFYVVSGMDQSWFERGMRRLGLAFYSVGLLMTLAAGLLACTFMQRPSQGLIVYAMPNFAKELLRGFAMFFVVPAAAFLLFVTVIGAPFAFLAGLMHLSFGIIAVVFTGIAEGAFLLRWIARTDHYEVRWTTALLGIPVAFLIGLLPYCGVAINAVFFLVLFGSLYERFWILIRQST